MLTPSKNLLRATELQRVWIVVILGQSCQVRQLADHAWEGPFAKCRRAPRRQNELIGAFQWTSKSSRLSSRTVSEHFHLAAQA